MALKETLDRIDELQNRISSYGKLSDETLKKIHYRFRLDWNYHSNAMEGNSLTLSETRSVMINNVTVEGKPLKDMIEIRGHDSVISDILRIGKGELRITEKRIKEIHKAIIHEDNPELAKKVGSWKTEPNHLINYKGEKFEFVPPGEVADEMHRLINWLNTERDLFLAKDGSAQHPVLMAFYFHLRYVSIHPFYDGNGRTARIFTNLILISFGYPPVIIEVEKKNIYNQYLADIQAYDGRPDLFLEFMCKQLINSMQLVLTAIEGGDIEQHDDLDKRILLLERELDASDPNNEIIEKLNEEVFNKIFSSWVSDLFCKVIPVIQKFNKFFRDVDHNIAIYNGLGYVTFSDESAESIIEKLKAEYGKAEDKRFGTDTYINFNCSFNTFKKSGLEPFGCYLRIEIKFDKTKYFVFVDEFNNETKENKKVEFKPRLLHQPFTPSEVEKVAKIMGESIYEWIDFNTKKRGIR